MYELLVYTAMLITFALFTIVAASHDRMRRPKFLLRKDREFDVWFKPRTGGINHV